MFVYFDRFNFDCLLKTVNDFSKTKYQELHVVLNVRQVCVNEIVLKYGSGIAGPVSKCLYLKE